MATNYTISVENGNLLLETGEALLLEAGQNLLLETVPGKNINFAIPSKVKTNYARPS
jgi:hypothetical protein